MLMVGTDLMQDVQFLIFIGDGLEQLLLRLLSIEVVARPWVGQHIEYCLFLIWVGNAVLLIEELGSYDL
jgi:hypothetical protein